MRVAFGNTYLTERKGRRETGRRKSFSFQFTVCSLTSRVPPAKPLATQAVALAKAARFALGVWLPAVALAKAGR